MAVRDELLALRAASADGMLHCEKAVDWAKRHKASALHAALEWDDKVAGEQYRIWQVRRLIEVHITSLPGGPTLVSLSVDRGKGGGYRLASDVIEVPDLRDVMLRDALAELQRVQVKYQRVQELAEVWQEVDKVRQAKGRKQDA